MIVLFCSQSQNGTHVQSNGSELFRRNSMQIVKSTNIIVSIVNRMNCYLLIKLYNNTNCVEVITPSYVKNYLSPYCPYHQTHIPRTCFHLFSALIKQSKPRLPLNLISGSNILAKLQLKLRAWRFGHLEEKNISSLTFKRHYSTRVDSFM